MHPYPAQFWDQRYAGPEFIYGQAPNRFFQQQLDLLPPGRLLLLAEGEGRNAVYAAQQGWQVTAVDFSAQARTKALALAAQRGVSLDYQLAALPDYDWGEPGQWEAIGLIFAHFPPAMRPLIHEQCQRLLAPGGVLILQAFNPRQLGLPSGGPKEAAMLYDPALLQADFAGLGQVHLAETTAVLDEGAYHQGHAELIELLARKPI